MCRASLVRNLDICLTVFREFTENPWVLYLEAHCFCCKAYCKNRDLDRRPRHHRRLLAQGHHGSPGFMLSIEIVSVYCVIVVCCVCVCFACVCVWLCMCLCFVVCCGMCMYVAYHCHWNAHPSWPLAFHAALRSQSESNLEIEDLTPGSGGFVSK